MIKITNGIDTLLVPNGAFKTLYQPNGWKPVGEADKPVKAVQTPVTPAIVPDQGVAQPKGKMTVKPNEGHAHYLDESLMKPHTQGVEKPVVEPEKPLSEMTSSELKRKARSLGIDISEMNSKRQVRDAIAAAFLAE